jgi:hypothetical protein
MPEGLTIELLRPVFPALCEVSYIFQAIGLHRRLASLLRPGHREGADLKKLQDKESSQDMLSFGTDCPILNQRRRMLRNELALFS